MTNLTQPTLVIHEGTAVITTGAAMSGTEMSANDAHDPTPTEPRFPARDDVVDATQRSLTPA